MTSQKEEISNGKCSGGGQEERRSACGLKYAAPSATPASAGDVSTYQPNMFVSEAICLQEDHLQDPQHTATG